eukprot:scaffold45444_cov19-Tisochrysis_lutea.AAC.1
MELLCGSDSYFATAPHLSAVGDDWCCARQHELGPEARNDFKLLSVRSPSWRGYRKMCNVVCAVCMCTVAAAALIVQGPKSRGKK